MTETADDEADVAIGTAEIDETDETDETAGEEQPWSWHAVQVSALFLVVLLTLQFVVTFVAQDIATTSAATVTDRWRDPVWRTVEWITLMLALLHGGLALGRGARQATWSDRARAVATGAIGSVTVGLMMAVTVVVLTLD